MFEIMPSLIIISIHQIKFIGSKKELTRCDKSLAKESLDQYISLIQT